MIFTQGPWQQHAGYPQLNRVRDHAIEVCSNVTRGFTHLWSLVYGCFSAAALAMAWLLRMS